MLRIIINYRNFVHPLRKVTNFVARELESKLKKKEKGKKKNSNDAYTSIKISREGILKTLRSVKFLKIQRWNIAKIIAVPALTKRVLTAKRRWFRDTHAV